MDILLHSGLTLREAHQIALDARMHLISDGHDVKVSPIIPPGWREIPIVVRDVAERRAA